MLNIDIDLWEFAKKERKIDSIKGNKIEIKIN